MRGHSSPPRIGRTITGSGPLKSYDVLPVANLFSGFAIPRESHHRGGVPLTTLRKALTASALVLMLSAVVPTHAQAEEREAPATQRAAAVVDWFSGLWNELAALFAADTTTPPTKPVGDPTTDSGCSINPWGGCGG